MSYNSSYLTNGVDEFLKNNVKFINLHHYNIETILQLMDDRIFLVNCFKAYIHNNNNVKIDNLLIEFENQINEN